MKYYNTSFFAKSNFYKILIRMSLNYFFICKSIKKEKAHPRTFDLLLVLTVFTAIYHGVRILSTIHK
jgi:hypothetical protein